MWKDPFVEELHKIREKHAEQFNGDMDAIFQDWVKIQRESGRQYISLHTKRQRVADSKSKYKKS